MMLLASNPCHRGGARERGEEAGEGEGESGEGAGKEKRIGED